jgi:uroporphyrinogen-III decarboxylase
MDYFVKRPEDYRVVEFMVRDTVYHADYDRFLLAQERLGEDGYAMGESSAGLWLGYSPMGLMMYTLLGVERFGIDLYDHPDEFFSLYEAIRERQRDMYRLCAESPAEVVCYAGNIHQDTMGLQRFIEYYLPSINEFADTMHAHGKLASCHYDARMRSLVKAVAASHTDIIEAFTPPPDCDVTVKEARAAWPDKVLWINFPSSVHLESPETIHQTTRQILSEAAPGGRFLIGITEDIPESVRYTSLSTILQTISEHGKLPIQV